MAIGQVVSDDMLRPTRLYHLFQVLHQSARRTAHDFPGLGVQQAHQARVFARGGGMALLLQSHFHYVVVAEIFVLSGPWARPAVACDHSRVPEFFLLEAFQDRMPSKKLQIVGMGSYAKVSCTGESLLQGGLVGHKTNGFGVREFHKAGSITLPGGRR